MRVFPKKTETLAGEALTEIAAQKGKKVREKKSQSKQKDRREEDKEEREDEEKKNGRNESTRRRGEGKREGERRTQVSCLSCVKSPGGSADHICAICVLKTTSPPTHADLYICACVSMQTYLDLCVYTYTYEKKRHEKRSDDLFFLSSLEETASHIEENPFHLYAFSLHLYFLISVLSIISFTLFI